MANKDGKCDKIFESASKSTLLTAGPTVCLLILAIVIIILTATQAFTKAGPSNGSRFVESWEDVCSQPTIEFMSPFHFESSEAQGSITVACQWRPRNTIFRIVICVMIILSTITSLIVLLSGKFETLWPVFYWSNWLIFVLMFVAFVLDCDGLNTGTSICQDDFKIDGVPFVNIIDFDETTFFGGNSFEPVEVEKCKVDPYIWTVLADLFASLVAFCAYKISRYYIFDPTERKASIAGFSGKIKKNSTADNKTNGATNNGRASTTEQQTAGNANNTNNGPNSDPFADYHGGYDVSPDNRKDTGGSAYGGGGGMSVYDE